MLNNRKFRQPKASPTVQQGFTLIELLMTIVILGFTSLILVPFFYSITKSPDPVIRERGVALGQAMMDEILAKKWDENTPLGGGPIITDETPASAPGNRLAGYITRHPAYSPATATTPSLDVGEIAGDRSNWNDVDDYNNHQETDTFRDQNNNSFALKGYSRQVNVGYINSNTNPITTDTAFLAAGTTDTKLIKVTVATPTNERLTFVAVVCNL